MPWPWFASTRARPTLGGLAACALLGLTLAACTAPQRYEDRREAVAPLWQQAAPADTVFEIVAPSSGTSAAQSSEPAESDARPELTAIRGFVRVYDFGESHRLILSNNTSIPGSNEVIAHLRPPRPGLVSSLSRPEIRTRVPSIQPDREWLHSEIQEQFPTDYTASGVRTAQNAYGDYAYVVLTGDGDATCLLAWQRLVEGQSEVFLPRGLSSVFTTLRYCDAAQPPSRIAQVFQRIQLDFLAARPGGDAGRLPSRWGQETPSPQGRNGRSNDPYWLPGF
ncbi:cellulose biosynthesis protein BcsN [Rhodovibrio salinarum]|uniref:Cellulose biosynthesis protein BcsN n=1 Tax=Rhodovibrio salinarum TaxID=1087 RepID=A0A934V208_9PROT|nr:cellulose biosynthesis protein BcsN [Rhodovibrio salinarum]MBK1698504.1 cellulose biosynthesis protein BcsN [Rhodovibrio salinarum]